MARAISTPQIQRFLGRIWAFELLEPAQIKLLARLTHVRDLAGEQVLWLQGQQVTHFTIVFCGTLRSVRRTSGGAEKLLSTLKPGHHFGLAEMITRASSAVTISADESATILTLDYRSLRTELLSDSDICFRLMQTMARAIFRLTAELERATFENVHTRLARLLLKTGSSRVSQLVPPSHDRKITHANLAVQLGVSRETVSRVLADFKKKKLVTTGYCNITVVDRDGLMDLVEDYDQW